MPNPSPADTLGNTTFTVVDVETTGLDPNGGHRICEVALLRYRLGRVADTFESLVNPQRPISAGASVVNRLTDWHVADAPVFGQVAERVRLAMEDSVLVAHNAAFDMRFLQLAEAELADPGVRFEQPVLDTLLLSAVVHPQQDNHSLEAIAQRLNVTVLGRHTALGDAMVTAEVFMKMLPLLRDLGIETLGQALAASQETYLARVSY